MVHVNVKLLHNGIIRINPIETSCRIGYKELIEQAVIFVSGSSYLQKFKRYTIRSKTTKKYGLIGIEVRSYLK